MTPLDIGIVQVLQFNPNGIRFELLVKMLNAPHDAVSSSIEKFQALGDVVCVSGLYYLRQFAPEQRNPLFSDNKPALFYDSGYVFYASVPIPNSAPKLDLDPESFKPRKGILTRYGKKLVEEGAKFYARLSVKDFPPPDNDVNIVEED